MFSVELSTREWDGHVVVAPHSRTAEPMTVNVGPALPSAARNMARRDPATVVLFPGCGDDR